MHFLTSIYKCKICFLPAPATRKGKGQGKSSIPRATIIHSSPDEDEINESPEDDDVEDESNESPEDDDVEVVDEDDDVEVDSDNTPVASRYVYNLH